MDNYTDKAAKELRTWCREMVVGPGRASRLTGNLQKRINRIIPERVHQVMTSAIKQVVRAVLFGSFHTTLKRFKNKNQSLEETEKLVMDRINFYCSSASAEGALTGVGGIWWGLADLPLWMALKMKMLYDISSLYGFHSGDLNERLYILYIFQLTFCRKERRQEILDKMIHWNKQSPHDSIHDFDWRTFQIEYRDHLDIAKLLQMIPGFGAIVGAYVNHRLTRKLGMNAMNAYRLRLIQQVPVEGVLSGTYQEYHNKSNKKE